MAIYYLPFEETQRGWFEIEADSLEQAKELAGDTAYVMDLEPHYKDGNTEWFPEYVGED
jgi:hypothetical protein